MLGGGDADGTEERLRADDVNLDRVLSSVYDAGRAGGLARSSPYVARWLGDIRTYFPASTVRVLQQDALDRIGLARMLLEPELLGAVEPDVHLVATLLSLSGGIPDETRETARAVVRKVVQDVEKRLRGSLVQAVRGGLDRAARTRRPRLAEVDWDRTIRLNLRHWQPDRKKLVVERVVGYARRRPGLRDVVLLLDQSASMATSVVYAGIAGAVLASIPSLSTRLVAFDTEVADLSEHLDDPVDVLFGVQLGGGTDIARALAYARQHVHRPTETVMMLVSDLFEGGDERRLLAEVEAAVRSGVTLVALLALSDDGAPVHSDRVASALAALGVPCFACTPDLFPELLATALSRGDVAMWAAGQGIAVAR